MHCRNNDKSLPLNLSNLTRKPHPWVLPTSWKQSRSKVKTHECVMCSPIPKPYYSFSLLLLIRDSLGISQGCEMGGCAPPWLDVGSRSQWDAQRHLQVFHQAGSGCSGVIANGCIVPGYLCRALGCFSQEGLGCTFCTSFRTHLLGKGEYKKHRKGWLNRCNK